MFPHFSVLSFSSLTLPPSPPKFRVSSHFSSPPLVCFLTLPHFFSPSTSTLPPVTLLHSYSLFPFFHTLYLSTPSLSINFFFLVLSYLSGHTRGHPHFCFQYPFQVTLLLRSHFFFTLPLLHISALNTLHCSHFCSHHTFSSTLPLYTSVHSILIYTFPSNFLSLLFSDPYTLNILSYSHLRFSTLLLIHLLFTLLLPAHLFLHTFASLSTLLVYTSPITLSLHTNAYPHFCSQYTLQLHFVS